MTAGMEAPEEEKAAPAMPDMGSIQLMLMLRWFEGSGRGILWWCVQLLRHALHALAWGRAAAAISSIRQLLRRSAAARFIAARG